MAAPTFSVVIPTRQNVSALSPCLRQVFDTSPHETEVITVVNGLPEDDDGTAAFLHGLIPRVPRPLRVLDIRPEVGFPVAANAGLAAARGKYLVVLHDDALVSAGWLTGLRVALRIAATENPETTWGYVGPFTNTARSRQGRSLKVKGLEDPAVLEQSAETIRASVNREYLPASYLDSFCLLMTREAYETVGGFDAETFGLGGYEDVDLIRRAQEAGILATYAPRVFVWHAGKMTLSKWGIGHHGDLRNQEVLMAKWRRTTDQTLCFAIVVQVTEDWEMDHLLRLLHQCRRLGTSAVLVDDRSTLPVLNRIRAAGLRDFIAAYHKNPEHMAANEVRDQNRALRLAQETKTDWIMGLDPWMLFQEKVTPEVMQDLLRPTDALTQGYRYPVRTLWRSEDYFRADGPWGTRTAQTLFRNLAWGGIPEPTRPGERVECFPGALPADAAPFTTKVVLNDHAYVDLARARRVRPEFTELPHLLIPRVEPTLTHLLMVRNEEDEIAKQIYSYRDWADRFLVMDTGSTDRTVEICERLGIRVIPYRCCERATDPNHILCDFAAARNTAIAACETSHILFLDADEELEEEGFADLPHCLLEDADGYLLDILNLMKNVSSGETQAYVTVQARLFRRDPTSIWYSPEIHETLEEAFKQHPEKRLVNTKLRIRHYGYLREKPGERRWKGERYAALLQARLKKAPNDPRSLYALGQHLNACHQFDEGDSHIAQALALDTNFFSARADLAFRFLTRAYDLFRTTPPNSIPTDDKRDMVKAVTAALHPWVHNL